MLANMAMDGLEKIVEEDGASVLIRYADDFLAISKSQEDIKAVKERLTKALEVRGLKFQEQKTKITRPFMVKFLGIEMTKNPFNGKVQSKATSKNLENYKQKMRTY